MSISGNKKNPDWDRYNYSNNHFVPVAFGFHMGFDVIFQLLFYVFCYWRVTCSSVKHPASFKTEKEDPESAILLNGELGN